MADSELTDRGRFPLFTSETFPRDFTHYSVPLSRLQRGEEVSVLFSVDWEKDHGRWRRGNAPSYRGIQLGTPALCELLDQLEVPCTWFVESNSQYPALDMASSCCSELHGLVSRERDEVGLHTHWGNFFGEAGRAIDLLDFRWLQQEVTLATEKLRQQTGKSVVSFRSGGHTLVPGLPGLLESLGYVADCSVEDRRRPLVRYFSGLAGVGVLPYHPDRRFANRRGDCALTEIPTSLHLHDFDRLRSRIFRFLVKGRINVLSLYIHIDELTEPQQDRLANDRLEGVRHFLQDLARIPGVRFRTVSDLFREQRNAVIP